MTIDLTQIIIAVIGVIAAIISKYLIPFIKSKIAKADLDTYLLWIKIAVEAAEQIYAGSGRGSEKKQYVLEFLESKGFKIDESSIDNLIESTVLELKNSISE